MKGIRELLNLLPIDWVYVMTDLRLRWTGAVGKVGITTKTANFRRADIESSIQSVTGKKTHVRVLLPMPVPGGTAQVIEQVIHAAYPMRFEGYKGSSGGTEWVRWPNVLAALLVFCFGWGNGQPVELCLLAGFVFLALPLAIDLALSVVLLGLVQWGLVLGLYGLLSKVFFAGVLRAFEAIF